MEMELVIEDKQHLKKSIHLSLFQQNIDLAKSAIMRLAYIDSILYSYIPRNFEK